MKRLRTAAVLGITIVGLTSCSGSGVTGQEEVGSLRAAVRSSQTTTNYVGSGLFVTGPELRGGIAHRFQLFSSGLGDSDGQSIGFYRFGAETPPVGVYELAPVNPANPAGFVAYYHRRTATSAESFVSLAGTVVVSVSTTDRVEGTFSIAGAQYCSTGVDSWCVSPLKAEGNRRIEITGSFVAQRKTEFAGQPLPL